MLWDPEDLSFAFNAKKADWLEIVMISRPDSPLGWHTLRGFAILLFLMSVGIWFPVAMVPDMGQGKMDLVWIAYGISALMLTTALFLYWWSFEQTPDLLELPLHARIFGILTICWIAFLTFGVVQSQAALIWRKR